VKYKWENHMKKTAQMFEDEDKTLKWQWYIAQKND
jgi:hypothetical protein